MTFPLPAIMQSNEPAGDFHDFMQESVECDYWVSGRAQLWDVRVSKRLTCFSFHLSRSTQHANCIDSELNMWHVVAQGMMGI